MHHDCPEHPGDHLLKLKEHRRSKVTASPSVDYGDCEYFVDERLAEQSIIVPSADRDGSTCRNQEFFQQLGPRHALCGLVGLGC
jgi:hypothetical protein